MASVYHFMFWEHRMTRLSSVSRMTLLWLLITGQLKLCFRRVCLEHVRNSRMMKSITRWTNEMKYYGHLMAPPSSSGSCLSCVWSLYINWVVYSALIITYRRWNNDDMYMFAWPWPILWEDASASITAIVNSWIKHNFCLWHSASFITLFCFWSWYKSVFWSLFQLPLNCFELISGLLMFFSVIQHPCDLFTCLVTKSFKLNFVASWFTIFFFFFLFHLHPVNLIGFTDSLVVRTKVNGHALWSLYGYTLYCWK